MLLVKQSNIHTSHAILVEDVALVSSFLSLLETIISTDFYLHTRNQHDEKKILVSLSRSPIA